MATGLLAESSDEVPDDLDAAPAAIEAAIPAADPAQAALDATVEELQAFVERQRGLTFTRPVVARLLDDAGFDELLAEHDGGVAPSAEELLRTERILKALGLITPELDLVAAASDPSHAGEGIIGLYDDDAEVLYARGASLTPLVRSVLVHELVHALDDQHFDLSKHVHVGGDLEERIAARALIEGNARRVENIYVDQLPDDERASVEAAHRAASETDDGTGFQIAAYYSLFPYLDGARFVSELAARGGERAVDAAYARPPRTTAEVLEPERYRAGITGTRLSTPQSPTPPVDAGMFGELGLFLLVVDAVGPEKASIAASTWEGDSYVAYEDGGRMCARVRFWLEGILEGEITAQILSEWAEQQPDATLEDLSILEVTTCR